MHHDEEMSSSRRRSLRRAKVGASALVVIASSCALPTLAAGGAATSVVPVTTTWVEPLNGYGFLANAINGARASVDLSIYELVDPSIQNDLIAKAAAGVDVRVLLDTADGGQADNAATFASLQAGGVNVQWAPTNQIFHAKYLVIGASVVFVGSGNLVASDYTSTRDYWIRATPPADVRAVQSTFNSDFATTVASPYAAPGLVWSPGSSAPLVRFINSARRTVLVENEEMNSGAIELALEHAAARGVDVKVVMSASPSWTSAFAQLVRHGVHVHTLESAQLYIHAKRICVDCTSAGGTVFIGSENFSTSSLSYNREFGLITRSRGSVRAVLNAAMSDYRIGSNVR